MKNLTKTFLGAASLATLCVATPAFAAIEGLSANAAFTTDYVFRGYSQTNGKAALQGGLDYDFGNGFSAGTWLSSVDFGDSTPLEWDVYGAYSGKITDQLTYDVGVIGYLYPESPAGSDYDLVEFHGGLGYDFGFASASGEIYYSPDIFGPASDASEYYSFGVKVPIVEWLSATAHYGIYNFEGASSALNYNDYSFGLAATYDAYTVSLMYTGTDDSAPERYVASLSFAL